LKKIIGILLVIFLIITVIPNTLYSAYNIDYLNGGWIEECDGVIILHQSGSHYQMGYQHGYYLREEIKENIRAVKTFNEKRGYNFDWLFNKWLLMEPFIPIKYISEINGIADGADISFKDIACFYMSFQLNGLMDCFGIVAWGKATKNGDIIHARSFDQHSSIVDPITGKRMMENSIIIVRKPINGFYSINPTIAGRMNGGGGFNSVGIAFGNMISWSRDQTYNGINFIIRGQEILDYSKSIQEAIKIIKKNKSFGLNYILSDSKTPIAYVIELSANMYYIGTLNNPIESTYPFKEIEYVLLRTNFFINPELAASQRNKYYQGGLIGFIGLLLISLNEYYLNIELEKDIINSIPFYSIFRNYKIIGKEIERNYGNLNLSNTLYSLRNVYSGRKDPILRIMSIFGKGHGFLESCNQWSANPKTGDILISFAKNDILAQFNEIHHFNLFKLLKTKPQFKYL
jgi:hypothetical protein